MRFTQVAESLCALMMNLKFSVPPPVNLSNRFLFFLMTWKESNNMRAILGELTLFELINHWMPAAPLH